MAAQSAAPEAPVPAPETLAVSAPVANAEAVGRGLVAENMIKNYVIGSVAAAIVPVPLFDIAAVVGIQLRMIQKLSELYGKPFSESLGRSIIASLAGGVVGYGAGMVVAVSLTKLIPGVGWMMGMVSLPVIAGGSTYAIGQVFMKHYENGGDISDLCAKSWSAFYQEQFEKGKELAVKAKAKAKSMKGKAEAEIADAV
ncbi:YcjF family protein [Magnetospirillum sulfuroxidans]|uniref:DUF697 domain-containing protein n=1 Tax=Magnetospirillum sulfuroxidans TaxID=611300 RepID=A0ABS5I7A9_9PROT|nr:DUF697 domain-containing protein [Magnetospirillum sulfuroxidans]MBR9970303.1 DUF697 domain-containing protein [Magnetospirillum sulfuroxidans]